MRLCDQSPALTICPDITPPPDLNLPTIVGWRIGNDESVQIDYLNGASTTILLSVFARSGSWLLTKKGKPSFHEPVFINGTTVEWVNSFKFLAVAYLWRTRFGPTHWYNHKESSSTPLLPEKTQEIQQITEHSIKLLQVYSRGYTVSPQPGYKLECPRIKEAAESGGH